MPSLRAAFLVAAFAATVRAGNGIDPDSVSLSIRDSWCASELSTCPLICQDMGTSGASVNTCDAESLTYGCLCNDGSKPNVTEYTLTLPYFICEEWGNQCVTGCGSDNSCASSCRTDNPCGATSVKKHNNTASSVPTTTSAAPTTIYSNPLGGSSAAARSASGMAQVWVASGAVAMFSLGFGYLL